MTGFHGTYIFRLETIHTSGDGDTALSEFDAEGIFLLHVDVEIIEFLWDLDADEFIAARSFHFHADQLAVTGGPLELLVDLSFDDVLAAAQAVSIFKKVFDSQLLNLGKARRLFPDEGLPDEDGHRDCGDGTNDEAGVDLGASASCHVSKRNWSGTLVEEFDKIELENRSIPLRSVSTRPCGDQGHRNVGSQSVKTGTLRGQGSVDDRFHGVIHLSLQSLD